MAKAAPETKELDELIEDPENPRFHNDRNIEMITDSIKSVGFGRSIVLDETNTVRAGNGTLKAAKRAGLKKVRIIDIEGDEVVALRRKNLTDEQKKLLALFDNRAGELAGWNLAVLKSLPDAERKKFFDDKSFRALIKANMVNEDVSVTDADAKAQSEPTIEHEVTIEIGCTKAALEGIRATLDEWASNPDISVTIV